MKIFILLLVLLSSTLHKVFSKDANFDEQTQILTIPQISFQEKSYSAQMKFLTPDNLSLLSLEPVQLNENINTHVPVYDDLSFNLSTINFNGNNYRADIFYHSNNEFQFKNLAPSLTNSTGKADFISTHFTGSANCTLCHDGISNDQNKDVSIVKAWQSTMMANSSRDPFWQAKLKSELTRTPVLAEVINDKCSRCHAPMANVSAKQRGTTITIFDDGFLSQENAYHDLAMEGVSCTLCHQISNAQNLGIAESFSGHYEIDTTALGIERKLFGPYSGIMTMPMQNNVAYTPSYSEHIKDSSLCATCHNLKTPYSDENGNILSSGYESEFPEQMPYSEWLYSDYKNTESCQQCHMLRSNGVIMASRPPHISTKRDDFAEHSFIGANLLMLNILSDYRQDLGVLAEDFTKIISATNSLLKTSAEIIVIKQSLNENQLDFTVQIKSHTGHKLPTSYPSRRLIVHTIVSDSAGNIVFESGKVNSDGSVQGLDSDKDLSQFETHYDLITSPEQVQAYEALMLDYKEGLTYTLLRAKQYIKDNRILPDGFDKQSADNDIATIGNAITDDNFIGGSDNLTYQVAGLNDNSYTVKVELIYQPLAYAFALDLFLDDSVEVNRFKQMYSTSQNKSQTITEVEFTIDK